jgi:hypothetical protein
MVPVKADSIGDATSWPESDENLAAILEKDGIPVASMVA